MRPPPLNQSNGTYVFFVCNKHIADHGDQQNRHENNGSPVETRCSDRIDLWPKAPEETPESIGDSERVDWDSELAQRELGARRRLVW